MRKKPTPRISEFRSEGKPNPSKRVCLGGFAARIMRLTTSRIAEGRGEPPHPRSPTNNVTRRGPNVFTADRSAAAVADRRKGREEDRDAGAPHQGEHDVVGGRVGQAGE